jgi:hypothetical protein
LHPVLDASSYEMDGPLAGLSRTHSSNQVFALDLTQTETQLAAGLSHNVRQRLRDWRRSGARLLDEPAQLKEFFMAEYAACMRRLGAAPVYDFPPALLEALLRHEALFLLGAENASGELEAVSVFGYTAHCGEYLFNVALPSGRRHSAALLWEGLRHLKSKDVPLANLGGGVQAGDGLAQFKARFGGQALPLRALKQVYRAEVTAQPSSARRAG